MAKRTDLIQLPPMTRKAAESLLRADWRNDSDPEWSKANDEALDVIRNALHGEAGERAYLVRCGECGFLGDASEGCCAKCGYDGGFLPEEKQNDGAIWVRTDADPHTTVLPEEG